MIHKILTVLASAMLLATNPGAFGVETKKGAQLLMEFPKRDADRAARRGFVPPPTREIEFAVTGLAGDRALIYDALLNDHVEGVLSAEMTSIDASNKVIHWRVRTTYNDEAGLREAFERSYRQVLHYGVIQFGPRLLTVDLSQLAQIQSWDASEGRINVLLEVSSQHPQPTSAPTNAPPSASASPPALRSPVLAFAEAVVGTAPAVIAVVPPASVTNPAARGATIPSTVWVAGVGLALAYLRLLMG